MISSRDLNPAFRTRIRGVVLDLIEQIDADIWKDYVNGEADEELERIIGMLATFVWQEWARKPAPYREMGS